jgi:cysteine-rich repeat protein
VPNQYQLEFEVLDWTNVPVGGVILWVTGVTSPGVTVNGASIKPDGRPILAMGDRANLAAVQTVPAVPGVANGWGGGEFPASNIVGYGSAFCKLTQDPTCTAATTISPVDFSAGVPLTRPTDGTCGSTVLSDVVNNACSLVPGGCTPPIDPNASNTVRILEAVDNSPSQNVLDGMLLTVSNWKPGQLLQLNWTLLDATGHLFKSDGTALGTAFAGALHPYSYGVLTIARDQSAPPTFGGAVGAIQNIANEFVQSPSNLCPSMGPAVRAAGAAADPFAVAVDSGVFVPAQNPNSVSAIATATGVTTTQLNDPQVMATNINLCGNGVRDPGEQCDDGNLASGDGCSSTCTTESPGTGGGGGGTGVPATPGPALAVLAVLLAGLGVGIGRRAFARGVG